MYNYYFAIASKNFLLNQEPIEEILRERNYYYKINHKEIDFWFVTNTNFMNIVNIKGKRCNISGPLAAIISLDHHFIQWLKLRIGFVHTGSFQSESLFIPN